MKTIYKIWCEWDMATASGYYSTKELANKAIDMEDWEINVDMTLEEVRESGMVGIEEEQLLEHENEII